MTFNGLTLLEIIVVLFIVYGVFNDAKLAAFEKRLWNRIKRWFKK